MTHVGIIYTNSGHYWADGSLLLDFPSITGTQHVNPSEPEDYKWVLKANGSIFYRKDKSSKFICQSACGPTNEGI